MSEFTPPNETPKHNKAELKLLPQDKFLEILASTYANYDINTTVESQATALAKTFYTLYLAELGDDAKSLTGELELAAFRNVLKKTGYSEDQIDEIIKETEKRFSKTDGRISTLTPDGRKKYNNKENFNIGAMFAGSLAWACLTFSSAVSPMRPEIVAMALAPQAAATIATATAGPGDRKNQRRGDIRAGLFTAAQRRIKEETEKLKADETEKKE